MIRIKYIGLSVKGIINAISPGLPDYMFAKANQQRIWAGEDLLNQKIFH